MANILPNLILNRSFGKEGRKAVNDDELVCTFAAMKRYCTILLLIIFLFDTGGSFVWFSLKQSAIRNDVGEEIEKGLDDSDLTLITVPADGETGLRWIRAGKEFAYHGELFDVVRIRKENRKINYYCLKDKKEKQLIADFNKNSNSRRESDKRIILLDIKYIPVKKDLKLFLSSADLTFPILFYLYQSEPADIHSPPPRLA